MTHLVRRISTAFWCACKISEARKYAAEGNFHRARLALEATAAIAQPKDLSKGALGVELHLLSCQIFVGLEKIREADDAVEMATYELRLRPAGLKESDYLYLLSYTKALREYIDAWKTGLRFSKLPKKSSYSGKVSQHLIKAFPLPKEGSFLPNAEAR